jgi:hypothetical protein
VEYRNVNAEHVDTESHSIGRRSILGFTAAAAALPISIRIGDAKAAGTPTVTCARKRAVYPYPDEPARIERRRRADLLQLTPETARPGSVVTSMAPQIVYCTV